MKPLAVILILLVLAALVGVGYLYFTSNLTVAFDSVVATDPLSQSDFFARIRSEVETETFTGTRYTDEPVSAPEDYLFYTWTVHLENHSFLPADTVEIRVTPMTGDVLLLGDLEQHSLASRKSMDLTATVLTARKMHSVREAIVSWYVWGLPFSTRLTLGK